MAKTSTSFKKGEAKGRPAGTPNKLTKTVKETVLAAFNDLQSDPKANIMTWAKDNPTDFYKIASKLIPTEVNANVEIVKAELPPFMKSHESES
jgi:hypothetical protein